jgi:MSHA biogenesis protein MshN
MKKILISLIILWSQVILAEEFIMERVPFSTVEYMLFKHKDVLQLLDSGKEEQAIDSWQEILQDTPEFDKARLALANLYYRKGWYYEAQELLQQGLKIDVNHAGFLKLLASILQEQGEYKESLHLLLQVPDKYHGNHSYQAMLASAYYHGGMFAIAGKYYWNLIQEDSLNSTWWLGLAVSQDAAGNYKQAVNNFKKVLELGKLNIEVLKFVDQRIVKLSEV